MSVLERIADILHNPTLSPMSKLYCLLELGIKRTTARKLVGL